MAIAKGGSRQREIVIYVLKGRYGPKRKKAHGKLLKKASARRGGPGWEIGRTRRGFYVPAAEITRQGGG